MHATPTIICYLQDAQMKKSEVSDIRDDIWSETAWKFKFLSWDSMFWFGTKRQIAIVRYVFNVGKFVHLLRYGLRRFFSRSIVLSFHLLLHFYGVIYWCCLKAGLHCYDYFCLGRELFQAVTLNSSLSQMFVRGSDKQMLSHFSHFLFSCHFFKIHLQKQGGNSRLAKEKC